VGTALAAPAISRQKPGPPTPRGSVARRWRAQAFGRRGGWPSRSPGPRAARSPRPRAARPPGRDGLGVPRVVRVDLDGKVGSVVGLRVLEAGAPRSSCPRRACWRTIRSSSLPTASYERSAKTAGCARARACATRRCWRCRWAAKAPQRARRELRRQRRQSRRSLR
jgi:hypothetical protein